MVTQLYSSSCPSVAQQTLVSQQQPYLATGRTWLLWCACGGGSVAFKLWEMVGLDEATHLVLVSKRTQMVATCDFLCPSCDVTTNVLPPFTGASGGTTAISPAQRDLLERFCNYELSIAV
ncbi:hypothetical protein H257_07937, partial [Aphanomyces astaci]